MQTHRLYQSQMGQSSFLLPSEGRNPFLAGGAYGEGSDAGRSTLLTNIQENEELGATAGRTMGTSSQEFRNIRGGGGNSMTTSLRGGVSRIEGPPEGAPEGLIQSIYGTKINSNNFDSNPSELNTADMCLSTLYLHELHHRQVKRRGIRTEQMHREMWHAPHQQQPQPHHSSFRPPLNSGSGGGGGDSGSGPVENTPLLGTKKS